MVEFTKILWGILKSRLYFLNFFAIKEVYIVLIQLKEIIELIQTN